MPGRISETLISSADASGSATFYFKDYKSATLGLIALGGTNPRATYSVKLYLTPDTPDAAAYTYSEQTVAGAVQVFDNVADTDGTPFSFYKMIVSYAGLTNDELSGAQFSAVVSAI